MRVCETVELVVISIQIRGANGKCQSPEKNPEEAQLEKESESEPIGTLTSLTTERVAESLSHLSVPRKRIS